MLLCNEYRTAYKTVLNPTAINRLLQAGWHELPRTDREPVLPKAPISDPLKYKGRSLSWYVQSGTVSDLRAVLRHIGVAYERNTHKNQLQALLKQQIHVLKEESCLDRS